jgi:winged helix DNA-binding protein
MMPELRVFRDEDDNELFDLPDAPRPEPEVSALVRFAPDYDNLVPSHADWRRVIADGDRKKVFLSSARVRATFLLDGLVAGAWKIEKTRRAATPLVEPFRLLFAKDRDTLAEEGERLSGFATDGASEPEVRCEDPGCPPPGDCLSVQSSTTWRKMPG